MIKNRIPYFPEINFDSPSKEINKIFIWRWDCITYLESESSGRLISIKLKLLLLTLLGSNFDKIIENKTYNLKVFPEYLALNTRREGYLFSEKDILNQIFYWRANIIDFLLDVWDTVDDPEFNYVECDEALKLFISPNIPETGKCIYCFKNTENTESNCGGDSHYDLCITGKIWSHKEEIFN